MLVLPIVDHTKFTNVELNKYKFDVYICFNQMNMFVNKETAEFLNKHVARYFEFVPFLGIIHFHYVFFVWQFLGNIFCTKIWHVQFLS